MSERKDIPFENVWIEIPTDFFDGETLTSELRKPSREEYDFACASFKQTGNCTCGKGNPQFIRDEESWPYDMRYCAVCGRGLGMV